MICPRHGAGRSLMRTTVPSDAVIEEPGAKRARRAVIDWLMAPTPVVPVPATPNQRITYNPSSCTVPCEAVALRSSEVAGTKSSSTYSTPGVGVNSTFS
jgi:hypothetical protein